LVRSGTAGGEHERGVRIALRGREDLVECDGLWVPWPPRERIVDVQHASVGR
jgi:hypothetical protein